MNIVVGINHPKQVYMFRNLINTLEERGHTIKILLVDKEISGELLTSIGILFDKIGENQKKISKKIIDLLPLTIKSLVKSYKFEADLFIGQAIPHIAFVSFLLKKPYLIFEDTENAKYPHLLANPFANYIITPNYFEKEFGKKQVEFNGSFENAYLNKKWFEPSEDILTKYGLSKNEKFSIVRFVNWSANHDIGHVGMTVTNKIKAIKEFKKIGKVIVSSEDEIPSDFKNLKVEISPIDMHHLICYSSLVYSEGATMAAEAAYLGTPSIFINDANLGYINHLIKYDLVYQFSESKKDQEKSIYQGMELLSSDNKGLWLNKSEKLNSDCIDVGSFMIWFVENYPESGSIMSENPNFQYRFK